MSRNVVSSYMTATLTPPVITRRHHTTASVTVALQETAAVGVTERKSKCISVWTRWTVSAVLVLHDALLLTQKQSV